MVKFLHIITVLVTLVGLASGCSILGEKDETADWTAETFLNTAQDYRDAGNWEQAIDYYRKLEGRFPYGTFAEQAQLDIAYVYFKSDQAALAIASADRFIQMHPVHPNVDYAYYLKGLAGFQPSAGLFSTLTGSDPSARDIEPVREALGAYRELVKRFPDSRYAPDARKRLIQIVNILAMHDVGVARYYYSRGAYVAAVNRAKHVLETYQTAAATEQALAVMADAYGKMGLAGLQEDALRVLRLNYPQSVFLPENS